MIATTTLKALRNSGACVEGYNKLVRCLQNKPYTDKDAQRETHIRFAHSDDIPLKTILDSNGLDDALWSLRACEQTKEMQRAERLYGVWCARQVQHLMTDQRSINALDVVERYADENATDEEFAAAQDAAQDAAWAAAGAAAWTATWAAAQAADRAAAGAAARADQKAKFIEMFCTE